MASLKRAGFTTVGIEPSPSFHDAALARGIPADSLACQRIETAEYAPDSFDFVSFGAVLEHLPDPSTAIARALEWARPRGLVYIEVPSSDWLVARLVDVAYRLQGLDYTCHISPFHAPFHLFEFTLEAFRAHAQRYGYEIAYHERYVGARTYAPRWTNAVLRPVMEKTATGMQLEVWLMKPAA